MKFLGDYHTHTIYSHGLGMIEHNVIEAVKKGLKQIAITDHGFRHVVFNVRRFDFKYMRQDIDRIKDKYDIDIFLGLETNLQSNEGHIDLRPQDIDKLDIILCGYHKLIYPSSLRAFFSFYLPNKLPRHKKSDLRKGRNTEAYLKAINRYPIDIIAHPKYGIEMDVVELAKECKRLGVYIELNGKRISMTEEEVLAAAETGVGFIVNSDAHSPEKVGDFTVQKQWIKKLNLNPDQIVNLGKIPTFRSRKLKGFD
ncbi:MAG: PHP domain-containing protein [Clostridiales bacterium]|jgi:putative hydrolase|nr:PHP domain-containing protein [Clostridiales bacterium]